MKKKHFIPNPIKSHSQFKIGIGQIWLEQNFFLPILKGKTQDYMVAGIPHTLKSLSLLVPHLNGDV